MKMVDGSIKTNFRWFTNVKGREKYGLSIVCRVLVVMAIEITCPTCGSHEIFRNGMT
jgi:transposase-like protein